MAQIPADYAQIDRRTAEDASGLFRLDGTQAAALLFYDGDHWQDGDGYRGPLPFGDDFAAEAASVLRSLAREWTSENKIKEITDRHRSGIAARPPSVAVDPQPAAGFIPAPAAPDPAAVATSGTPAPAASVEEDPAAADLREQLAQWLQRQDVSEAIRTAISNALIVGRGPLRFYVPPTQLDEEGRLRPASAAEALSQVYLEAPDPQQAGVFIHPTTRQPLGIFQRRDSEEDYIEWVYTDADGLTVYTTESSGSAGQASQAVAISLAECLPIYDLRRQPLITEQILSAQRQLNLAVTMRSRNVTAAGFVERTLLNAQIAGTTTTDAQGREIFRPDPIVYGAGVTNSFRGIPTTDSEGRTTYTTPQIEYRDPTDPDAFIKTRDAAYRAILEEAHQLHYLIAGDATPSGASRIAAMADHITALLETKANYDLALSWVLKTATAYIELLSNQPGKWTANYTIRAEAKLDAGPISSESQRATRENYAGGLLSKRTAMEWIGIEEPEQEERQIREEAGPGLEFGADAAAERIASNIALLSAQRQQRRQQQDTNGAAQDGEQSD